jgi:hypothetical protein
MRTRAADFTLHRSIVLIARWRYHGIPRSRVSDLENFPAAYRANHRARTRPWPRRAPGIRQDFGSLAASRLERSLNRRKNRAQIALSGGIVSASETRSEEYSRARRQCSVRFYLARCARVQGKRNLPREGRRRCSHSAYLCESPDA